VDIARDSWTPAARRYVALNIASLARAARSPLHRQRRGGRETYRILHERKIDTLPTPGAGATICKTRVLVQHQQLAGSTANRPADTRFRRISRGLVARDRTLRCRDFFRYASILTDAIVARLTKLARAAGNSVALDPSQNENSRFTASISSRTSASPLQLAVD